MNQKSTIYFTALLLITLALGGCTLLQGSPAPPAPPPHFEPLAELDLSAGSYTDKTVGAFTLPETAVTGIYFVLQQLDSEYFDLRLITPDGEAITILHSEGLRTDQDGGGLWEENLPAGDYRLELTAHQGLGRVAVYWGQQ